MRHSRIAFTLVLTIPLVCAIAQNQPASVKIRFGQLDTTSYPAPGHATEWVQELFADLYDASGHALPPRQDLQYTWGVDFCRGLGMQFGWASGNGLYAIRPDGNKLKNEPGCCAECPFQTFNVAVRVTLEDAFIQSETVRVPDIPIPSEPGLSLNYPNPLSSSTQIRFQLNQTSHVELRVYDVLGRMITELLNLYLPAGHHKATWNSGNNTQGIYFYRLTITQDKGRTSTYTEKMIVVR